MMAQVTYQSESEDLATASRERRIADGRGADGWRPCRRYRRLCGSGGGRLSRRR